MKLCWLIPDDRGGGIASVALSCCRQAARAGHEVTLLMALPPTGHLDEHVEGFTLASLDITKQGPEGPRRLTAWLAAHPQDVLLLNGCSEVEPALPHLPQPMHVVEVVHDTAPAYWQRAVAHEAVLDAVVAVSETVASQVRPHLAAPARLHVLHNGTVFPPRPPDDAPRPDDLLFVGASKPVKGAGDVLDLWPALVRKGFGGRLHWFGGLTERLKARVAALPEAHRVVDHGRVPRSQLFAQAARAKVVLMLSRVEPFGMVTIEGMGMGAVPVAWDIETGTKEIVTPGATGFFAPLGDVDALADRVLDACARHDALRDAVVEVARTRFSEAAMWARYAALLDTVTARPPAPRPLAGSMPPDYEPPTRYFQLLPDWLRTQVREVVARSPRLGYLLRDWRGV